MKRSLLRNVTALGVGALALMFIPLSIARGGEDSCCGSDSQKTVEAQACPIGESCPPAACQIEDAALVKESPGGGDDEKASAAHHEMAAEEKKEKGEHSMMNMSEHHEQMKKNIEQLDGIFEKLEKGNLTPAEQKELGAKGKAAVHEMKEGMETQHSKMMDMGEMKKGSASQPTSQPTSQPSGEKSELMNNFCPISGDAISMDVKTEYNGKTVYFCCKDCIALFKENPKKYLAKLPQFGGKE